MAGHWKTIERYVYVGVAAGLVILVAIGSISYRNLSRVQSDFNNVSRTRKAFLDFSYFLSNIKNAEMNQGEESMTNQDSYPESYQYVESRVKHYFSNILGMAPDNIASQNKLNLLEGLIDEKLSELQEFMVLQSNSGAPTTINDIFLTETGKEIIEDIQISILGIDEDEGMLLDEQSKSMAVMVKRDIYVKTVGMTVLIFTAGIIFFRGKLWVAEYKKLEQKRIEMANTDELTGLVNRRFFFEMLERELLRAKLQDYHLAMLIFDIDHFKNINDTYGHPGGDKVLEQMGKILRENVYPLDVVARYGGEEFIILMPEISPSNALQAGERLRNIIDQFQWQVFDKQISVTASIGLINIDPNNLLDSYDLMSKVDTALYAAKRQGRNRLICWDENNMEPEHENQDTSVYHELQTKIASLRKQLDTQVLEIISAFNNTIESVIKDPYLIQHSENVKAYADAISEEMGLSAELRERIGVASLLHDLGKISVPIEILTKASPLTEDEWEVIKRHPVAAAKILEPMGILNLELDIIKHHHEKFDGGGYPAGLNGRNIPFGARILAAADAFDAITSNRVHQHAQSYEAALEEISDCSGSQFDPEIVEALYKAVEKHKTEWFLSNQNYLVSST